MLLAARPEVEKHRYMEEAVLEDQEIKEIGMNHLLKDHHRLLLIMLMQMKQLMHLMPNHLLLQQLMQEM